MHGAHLGVAATSAVPDSQTVGCPIFATGVSLMVVVPSLMTGVTLRTAVVVKVCSRAFRALDLPIVEGCSRGSDLVDLSETFFAVAAMQSILRAVAVVTLQRVFLAVQCLFPADKETEPIPL